jgi:hypothetical protein
MQLDIKKDGHFEVLHGSNCILASRAKELKADFGDADAGPDGFGDRDGSVEVWGIESDG